MKRRGLRPASWLKARALYESGIGISAICRRFRVSPHAVRHHRMAEGWCLSARAAEELVSSPLANPKQLHMAAREKIIAAAVQKGVDAASPQAVQAVADTIQSLLSDTLPLARRTLTFAQNAIAYAEAQLAKAMSNSAEPAPREGWSAFSSSAVSTSAHAIALIREMGGLKLGQSTVPVNAQKARVVKYTVTTPAEMAAKINLNAHNDKAS